MSRRFQGLNAWLLQRVSALYLAVFILYLLFHFTLSPPASYHEWRAWVAGPVISTGLYIFVLLLLGHTWVGVRDVLMDYVSSLVLRAVLLLLLAFSLVAAGIWVARILVMVSLVSVK